MSERQTLTRAERLRTIGVIRRLFGEGESRFVYPFRIVWLPAQVSATDPAPASSRAAANAPGSATAQAFTRSRATVAATGPATTQAPTAVHASGNSQASTNLHVTDTVAESVTSQAPTAVQAPETVRSGLRILFSVPKKYHKRANRRNLLRRRTKEAYRLQKSALRLAQPYDLALIYTSREVESYDRIAHAVRKIIDHLNALGR